MQSLIIINIHATLYLNHQNDQLFYDEPEYNCDVYNVFGKIYVKWYTDNQVYLVAMWQNLYH